MGCSVEVPSPIRVGRVLRATRGLESSPRGKYVLFADHDDVLYPESLERAEVLLARENQAKTS